MNREQLELENWRTVMMSDLESSDIGGDRLRHLDHAYGHDLSLDVYWTSPDRIAELVTGAGMAVTARLVREPDEQERFGQGRQAYLLARRPPATG